MNSPLLWLNALLAVLLWVAYTQRDVFLEGTDRRADLVFIAAAAPNDSPLREIEPAILSFEGAFGREVTVLAAGDDGADALARALRRAVAMEPAGISMPGHVDSGLLLPFVTEARRRGIAVTFHSVPFPEAESRYMEAGAGFVGAGGQWNGELATRASLRTLSITDEATVLVAGKGAGAVAGSLLYGCLKVLEETGATVEYISVPEGTGDETELSHLLERMRQLPAPAVLYWDAGDVSRLTSALDLEGFDYTEVHVVSFSPAVTPGGSPLYIKQRYYEPKFLNCYFSLVQLSLAEQYGVAGMHIPVNATL